MGVGCALMRCMGPMGWGYGKTLVGGGGFLQICEI